MSKAIGHVIDKSTGRVAEVRRKANGKKLLYIYTGKSTDFGDPEKRAYWQDNMKPVDAFGCKVGEIPQGINAPTETPVQTAPTPASKADSDFWQPSEQCPPDEAPAPTDKNSAEQIAEQPKKSGLFKKVLIGASVIGLAFAGYHVSTKQMGAE